MVWFVLVTFYVLSGFVGRDEKGKGLHSSHAGGVGIVSPQLHMWQAGERTEWERMGETNHQSQEKKEGHRTTPRTLSHAFSKLFTMFHTRQTTIKGAFN